MCKSNTRFPILTPLLLSIVLLAFALRVYRLDVTPPGLHYDEAFNAIEARQIARTGQLQVFFVGNFGTEPLHSTTMAVLFKLVGERIWAVRLTSAFYGVLFICAIYFCARVFLRSAQAALIAAFIAATMYWSLNFSRIGIETITLAPIITWHMGTWLAMTTSSLPSRTRVGLAVLSGIFAGAVYYTYLASRITPLVLVLFGIYVLIFHRTLVCANLRTIGLATLVAILTLAPLAWFFANNPTAFFARAGQVLTPEGIQFNLLATAGMFVLRGDVDPRNNLPGRPALDLILAVFFIAGILTSLRRWRQPPYALLLIWFIVLTLPAIVTEFAPNFRRAIGALPAVILLCALGAKQIITWRTYALRNAPYSSLLAHSTLIAALLFSGFISIRDYFVEWAGGTGLYYSFDAGLLRVAEFLAARPSNERLFLSPSYPDHPTVLWAMDGRLYSTFDGRRVAVLPDSEVIGTCGIITYEDRVFSPSQFFPNAQRLASFDDFTAQPYAQVFQIPARAVSQVQPQHPLDARVGESVRMLGYTLALEGQRFDLQIFWYASQPIAEDYTVFVHLLGPPLPTAHSPLWSDDDAQPGHGTYPTTRWRPGETIIDRYALKLPDNAPPADYQIEAGMYLFETGERLPVVIDGKRIPEDRLVLDLEVK